MILESVETVDLNITAVYVCHFLYQFLPYKYLSSNCNSSKIYISLKSVKCLNVKWLTVRAVDADNRNCSNPVDPTS